MKYWLIPQFNIMETPHLLMFASFSDRTELVTSKVDNFLSGTTIVTVIEEFCSRDLEMNEFENVPANLLHCNEIIFSVCTSRFWFNYRHVANTLSVYRSVKRLGIPDSHIVLMLADDMACNPRNPKPATVFSHKNMELNVYGDDVEVDYRSYEKVTLGSSLQVTVENFLRVLTGRIPPSTPRSKRLLSDDRSNILIYMTGHGGNGFLKFQDSEEITNVELADAFEQMWQKRRYNELLFIIDTCQGASMYERFYSPNIMALASSQVGEDSLSHQPDLGIGVHLMDRYTFYVLEFLEEIHPASQTNMNDLVNVIVDFRCEAEGKQEANQITCDRMYGNASVAVSNSILEGAHRDAWGMMHGGQDVIVHLALQFQVCPKSLCVSTPGHRTDLFQRDPGNVLITDFFGSVRKVEITAETLALDRDVAAFESKFPEDELAAEPLKYAEQLPVAQIIHQVSSGLGQNEETKMIHYQEEVVGTSTELRILPVAEDTKDSVFFRSLSAWGKGGN
ncbi:GPI-anchor transamidase [Pitangus sulphuratus]|nr:GPI-anchor transamidase [Pitangus sulphuratus]